MADIENLEFLEIHKLPKTQDKKNLFLVASQENNGDNKAVTFPAENLVEKDYVDTQLGFRAQKKDLDSLSNTVSNIENTKADKSELYPIRENITDLQNNKLDKSALDSIQVGIKRYKDKVTNISDLPTTGNEEGDGRVVVNDKDSFGNSFIWVWDGSKWSRTAFTTLPSDVATKQDLDGYTKNGGSIKTLWQVDYEKIGVLTPSGVSANGRSLVVSDFDNTRIVDVINQTLVSISGTINSDGSYIAGANVYYRSDMLQVPSNMESVLLKSFETSTNARCIAFYDANKNKVLVPDNIGAGALITIQIPENAVYYIVSRNINSNPFTCEFFYKTSLSNNNEISVFDTYDGNPQKTVLKKLSNLDLLDSSSIPNENKHYLALPDSVSQNFIDSRIAISNSNFSLSGYINRANGVLVTTNPSYISTDYLSVGKFSAFIYPTHSSTTACNIAFYDADRKFISADTASSEGIYTPENAVYYRLCKFLSNVDYQAYGVSSVTEIAKSEININGYIERANGNINAPSPYGYFSSDFIDITNYLYVIISVSHGSGGACDFAFYDADKKFISANPQSRLMMAKPVNAVYARICYNTKNEANYKCTLSVGAAISINATSVLQYKFGTWISKPLYEDSFAKNIRGNNITVSLVPEPTNIVGSGTNSRNLTYSETYLEKFEMSTNFEVISDTISVWTGKSYIGIKLKSDKIETYKINSSLNGTELFETIELPFPITKGGKYTIGFEKVTDGVRYYIHSIDGTFEKIYNKQDNSLAAIMWGIPFFGVESGEVKVYSSTISTKFNPSAKLYIAGDSFIEGATMVAYGLENRWCAKLANAVGELATVIDGKGGEAINGAFISRFKVTSDWFNSKYVIVSLGTNNYGNVAAYKNDMQTLIDYIKGNNQIPILVTCTPRVGSNYETTVKVINDWVKATGEFYIDMHKAVTKPNAPDQWRDGYVLADAVHPSVLGHEAMFHQIKIDCPFLFQL